MLVMALGLFLALLRQGCIWPAQNVVVQLFADSGQHQRNDITDSLLERRTCTRQQTHYGFALPPAGLQHRCEHQL